MFKAGVLGGTGLHYYDVPPGTDKSFAALVRLKLHLYCEIHGANLRTRHHSLSKYSINQRSN